MNYREYNPEREVIEKYLKAARSELLHVLERMKLADLSQEDQRHCIQAEQKITFLIKKLESQR